VGVPSQPQRFEKEGSASPCVIGGINLSWKNCTPLSTSMGLNKSTLGRVDTSGCSVRDETHDKAGGTTLIQMQPVCAAHGVATEAHTGGNVASLWYLSTQCRNGRGFVLQGNTGPDGRGTRVRFACKL